MNLNETVYDLLRMPWKPETNPVTNEVFLSKTLHVDEETGMVIKHIRFPKGYKGCPHKFNTDCWVYITNGQLASDDQFFGPDTMIKYPKGCLSLDHSTDYDDVELFFISSSHYEADFVESSNDMAVEKEIIDVKGMPWFYRATSTDGKIFGKKGLVLDDETGIQINYMNYPAGFTTYNHKHTAGHCFFVFSGQLQSGGNYYGPGTFIWYPQGCITDHGASAYEDLICLQISNKSFAIEYVK